jgi:predicted ATP-dependent Lon-type protease
VLVEALEQTEKFSKSDCIDAYVMLSDALVKYDRIRNKSVLYPNKIYNIKENKTCE